MDRVSVRASLHPRGWAWAGEGAGGGRAAARLPLRRGRSRFLPLRFSGGGLPNSLPFLPTLPSPVTQRTRWFARGRISIGRQDKGGRGARWAREQQRPPPSLVGLPPWSRAFLEARNTLLRPPALPCEQTRPAPRGVAAERSPRSSVDTAPCFFLGVGWSASC